MRFDYVDGRPTLASGVQTLDRAMAILAELAAYTPLGMRSIDLSKAVGVTPATGNRILQALAKIGLVVQEKDSPRYKMGALGLALESAAPPRLLIEAARPHMERITSICGQTTMLMCRQGRFGMVAAFAHGDDDWINSHRSIAKLGYVSLLGMSCSSIGIFSGLDDAQVEEILFANEWHVFVFGAVDFDQLMTMVRDARARGYARTGSHVVEGIGGISTPIIDSEGQTLGAITVLARTETISDEFCALTAPELKAAAAAVADTFRKLHTASAHAPRKAARKRRS